MLQNYKTCKNDMKYISSAFSLIKATEYRFTFVTCCSTSPLQGLNMYASLLDQHWLRLN